MAAAAIRALGLDGEGTSGGGRSKLRRWQKQASLAAEREVVIDTSPKHNFGFIYTYIKFEVVVPSGPHLQNLQ